MKPGNRILADAFPASSLPPISEQTSVEFPFDILESSHHISKIPLKDPKIDLQIEAEDLFAEIREAERSGIREIVQRKGVHALAWYLPYSIFGKKWGIYYDYRAIEHFSILVWSQIKEINPNITWGSVNTFVWSAIQRHEVEHCLLEVFCAQSSNLKKAQIGYLDGRKNIDYRYWSEINATKSEMFDTRHVKKLDPFDATQIHAVYQEFGIGNVPPYSNWLSESSFETSRKLNLIFGISSDCRDLEEIRRASKGRPSSPYLKIPERLWVSNRVMPDIGDASLKASLDCAKTVRWVIKSETRCGRLGIKVEHGNDHDIKFTSKHVHRPIKMGCHDWDRIPPKVVSELSIAYNCSKSELVQLIRQNSFPQ